MKPGFVEMDYNVLITQKHYKSQNLKVPYSALLRSHTYMNPLKLLLFAATIHSHQKVKQLLQTAGKALRKHL